jgi:hypothetical protein
MVCTTVQLFCAKELFVKLSASSRVFVQVESFTHTIGADANYRNSVGRIWVNVTTVRGLPLAGIKTSKISISWLMAAKGADCHYSGATQSTTPAKTAAAALVWVLNARFCWKIGCLRSKLHAQWECSADFSCTGDLKELVSDG